MKDLITEQLTNDKQQKQILGVIALLLLTRWNYQIYDAYPHFGLPRPRLALWQRKNKQNLKWYQLFWRTDYIEADITVDLEVNKITVETYTNLLMQQEVREFIPSIEKAFPNYTIVLKAKIGKWKAGDP
jgi:hypothetical protein